MEPVVISKKLLKRLPLYLAHLKALPENSNVSATSMAKVLGLGEVMVRKDLAKISETGRRRTGRSRERLIRDIEEYLYLAVDTPTVVVGAGMLGMALLDYDGFETSGFQIQAAFSLEPCAASSKNGKPIYPISRLARYCSHHHVRVGIITVPTEQAQEVCDVLISCGVSAIWNFAPVHLRVPEHVIVQSENLADSLTALGLQMRKQKPA